MHGGYPLSEEDFLVSARGAGDKFRLYLMDVHGNRELVFEGVRNVWHAMPVKPRPVPPTRPDSVVWPGTGKDRKPVEPGVFFSVDIAQGANLPRDAVKYLRVFQQDYKTYSTWNKTYRHSGPAVSIVQEESVKRILSEVATCSRSPTLHWWGRRAGEIQSVAVAPDTASPGQYRWRPIMGGTIRVLWPLCRRCSTSRSRAG